MPRNSKEHATIAGLRNQHASVARHEGLIQQDVRTTRDTNKRASFWINHATDRINPSTSGIEDHLRANREFFTSFLIGSLHSTDRAAFVDHTRHRHVVKRNCTVIKGGTHQGNGQAGVVKLTVIELHTAHQTFRLHTRQSFQGLFARQGRRTANAITTVGHGGINAQTHRVEFAFTLVIARKDERLGMHQMRSILNQNATFFQRFTHQTPITRILHVAHAAMNKFRRTGRGPSGEVLCFEQDRLQATRSGINGDTRTSGTTTDHNNVPYGIFTKLGE